jgi:hypothetical protein
MYIRRIKMMRVPFKFCTVQKTTNEVALLDSRATENFIDEVIWKKKNIGRFRLPFPLTVHNVDGTENRTGKIEFYCWLKIHHQGWMVRMRFYLTSLGGDDFIFGYLFLFAFNPVVDWCRAKLPGGVVRVEMAQYGRAEQWVEQCQKAVCCKAGRLAPEEEIWIQHTTMAQQWA